MLWKREGRRSIMCIIGKINFYKKFINEKISLFEIKCGKFFISFFLLLKNLFLCLMYFFGRWQGWKHLMGGFLGCTSHRMIYFIFLSICQAQQVEDWGLRYFFYKKPFQIKEILICTRPKLQSSISICHKIRICVHIVDLKVFHVKH